jgi:signal transduction histidine kinase
VAAIESYANDVKRDEVTISVDAHGYWLGDESLRPPMKLEETLFRVAQEALNNVMKHAHAHRVHITLGAQDQIASLEVRDDGFGFDIQAEWSTQDAKSRGIGLQTMRERVEAQHGHLQITSAVGQGTTLVARIPWQEREKKWKPVAQRQGLK